MTISQDEAIQMARELGIGLWSGNDADLTHKELTAFANEVRRRALLEAADEFDSVGSCSFNGEEVAMNLRIDALDLHEKVEGIDTATCKLSDVVRRMADEPHVP